MEGVVASAAVEFAAVVLGVLIALWVNSWNGRRNDRQREQNYLRSLRDDIESDRIALAQYIAFADGTAAAAAALLRIVRGQDDAALPRETLLRQLKRAGMLYPFRLTDTTFQELSGGGGLRLISDRGLLRQAIDYYAAFALPRELVALAIRRIWHDYYDALVTAIDPPLIPVISLDVFNTLLRGSDDATENDQARPLPDVGVVPSTATTESIRGNVQFERALAIVLDSAIVVRESMTDLLASADRLYAALDVSVGRSKRIGAGSGLRTTTGKRMAT
jgi:hypothetical protein